MNKNFGVYVHIPFCGKKCIYCDFASFVSKNETKKIYFDELEREILSFNQEREVSTIYFGGGTPSSVDVACIEKVFNAIKSKFIIKKNAEITIECNPNSTDINKLIAYKKMGFNRVSFGVQSLQDRTLKQMGRLHTAHDAIKAISDAKKAGFKNISADLMIGFSKQTLSKLKNDITVLSDLGVDHISLYMLQIEEGASLYAKLKNNEAEVLDEDKCEKIFSGAVEFLNKLGYSRYEISNFAKKGKQSRHNSHYWCLGEYVGFGLGAHSYLDGKRIANSNSLDGYYAQNKKVEELSVKEQITELIMLGLRCSFGVSLKKLRHMGYNLEENKSCKMFLENGILSLKRGRVYLNPRYYDVSNSIICDLII